MRERAGRGNKRPELSRGQGRPSHEAKEKRGTKSACASLEMHYTPLVAGQVPHALGALVRAHARVVRLAVLDKRSVISLGRLRAANVLREQSVRFQCWRECVRVRVQIVASRMHEGQQGNESA